MLQRCSLTEVSPDGAEDLPSSVRAFHEHHLRKWDVHSLGDFRQPARCPRFQALEELVAPRIGVSSVQFRSERRKHGSPREGSPLRAERAGVLSAFKVLPDSILAAEDLEVLDR